MGRIEGQHSWLGTSCDVDRRERQFRLPVKTVHVDHLAILCSRVGERAVLHLLNAVEGLTLQEDRPVALVDCV